MWEKPLSCHALTCLPTLCSTHSSISVIKPVSSARGMNLAGGDVCSAGVISIFYRFDIIDSGHHNHGSSIPSDRLRIPSQMEKPSIPGIMTSSMTISGLNLWEAEMTRLAFSSSSAAKPACFRVSPAWKLLVIICNKNQGTIPVLNSRHAIFNDLDRFSFFRPLFFPLAPYQTEFFP
jgi:hypothetical protein